MLLPKLALSPPFQYVPNRYDAYRGAGDLLNKPEYVYSVFFFPFLFSFLCTDYNGMTQRLLGNLRFAASALQKTMQIKNLLRETGVCRNSSLNVFIVRDLKAGMSVEPGER